VLRAFAAARWSPADPITLESSLAIALSVVMHDPDPDAPVSTLLLFDRKQDLAFEQDVGGSADQRNHVRFWRTEVHGNGGQPVWVGAATFDHGVGLSHTTGQITHHIGPDLDAERDRLMHDLDATGISPTARWRWACWPRRRPDVRRRRCPIPRRSSSSSSSGRGSVRRSGAEPAGRSGRAW